MELIICIALLSAIKRETRKVGKIKGAGRAESFHTVEDTPQLPIGLLRGGKKLEASSFPRDKTDDNSRLVT
jgi:hypothetical protein